MAKPSDLGEAIADRISQYNDQVKSEIQDEIKQTAKKTRDEIKEKSPKRTGEYAGGWSYRKTGRGDNFGYTVYNREHYQLTRLLEFPHAARDGSIVSAQPHIGPAIKIHVETMTERIEQILQRVGDQMKWLLDILLVLFWYELGKYVRRKFWGD